MIRSISSRLEIYFKPSSFNGSMKLELLLEYILNRSSLSPSTSVKDVLLLLKSAGDKYDIVGEAAKFAFLTYGEVYGDDKLVSFNVGRSVLVGERYCVGALLDIDSLVCCTGVFDNSDCKIFILISLFSNLKIGFCKKEGEFELDSLDGDSYLLVLSVVADCFRVILLVLLIMEFAIWLFNKYCSKIFASRGDMVEDDSCFI